MIYLDHAATGLPRRRDAVAALEAAAELTNPGRGTHSSQQAAGDVLEQARRAVAELASGGTPCFCAGATAALNQAILGVALPDDAVVGADPALHNATRRPLAKLGRRVWTLPHDAMGRVDLATTQRDWPASLALLVVTHGSNVTGVIQPLAELSQLAHQRGALVVADCAQTVGLDAQLEIGDADLVAFSSHKGLRAPPGAGALIVRNDVRLEPLICGGTGADAEPDTMPDSYPARLEAGTRNLPGIHALGVAARAAQRESWPWRERARALHDCLEGAGVRVLARGELPLACFNIAGHSPTEVEQILDTAYAIVVRAGLHCAPAAHRLLGSAEQGAVRVSIGSVTTDSDLALLRSALRDLVASRSAGP